MKKRISLLLMTLIALNTSANITLAKSFSDMTPSHWAYDQIQSLADDSVVVGYPNGTFLPDNPATRAEFATMVIKALRQENSPLADTFYFTDVPDSHWAYNTIQRAYAFDLIKGFPDGTFKPADNISKAEAVAIIISAINTGDLSEEKAREALKVYADIDTIPNWAIIPAGKSEILDMTVHIPNSYNKFEPDRMATRAEIAVNLYNMRKQAQTNPNAKLAEAMIPKKGKGLIIDNVAIDGTIATIPQGAIIPAVLQTSLNSQKNETGEVFVAKVTKNLVTKDDYLLIYAGSNISGDITDIKPARYFVRNGKMTVNSKYINTVRNQKSELPGSLNTKQKFKWYSAMIRFVIKGSKINLPEGKEVNIKLSKPVRVDLTNGTILK